MGQFFFFFFFNKFRPFDTSDFSIQEIITETKLTRHWKVRNQINTIKMLGTKLKYDIQDGDQICSLPFI